MNSKPGVWYLTMPSEMADKHERFWEEEIERENTAKKLLGAWVLTVEKT